MTWVLPGPTARTVSMASAGELGDNPLYHPFLLERLTRPSGSGAGTCMQVREPRSVAG